MTDNAPTVLFMRARRGLVSERHRLVHVVPAPQPAQLPHVLTAYCRIRIPADDVDLMDKPLGMPCVTCLACAQVTERGVFPALTDPLPPRPRLPAADGYDDEPFAT
jgi:hypothetical protein